MRRGQGELFQLPNDLPPPSQHTGARKHDKTKDENISTSSICNSISSTVAAEPSHHLSSIPWSLVEVPTISFGITLVKSSTSRLAQYLC